MSFDKRKEHIELGDTVILYLSAKSLHAIKVEPQIKSKRGSLVDNVFQTTYGALKVESLIGKKYGSKVNLSRGWAYVIHPTPELWTRTLPHRTQILYFADISMIIMQLEIRPGSIVVESGTGSGSLSHALIRNIKPEGFLHTFDFHLHRVAVAQAEFEEHGLGSNVSIKHRDVCKDGFGAELNGKADAVFLDLPKPWEVVPHAVAVFKETGGRFVSFSPCIEQVQRTSESLTENLFTDIVTVECLQKEYQVLTKNIPIVDLDPINIKQFNDVQSNAGAKKLKTAGVKEENSQVLTAVLPTKVPGHTGYLTSASLPPLWARQHFGKRPRLAADSIDADPVKDTVGQQSQ